MFYAGFLEKGLEEALFELGPLSYARTLLGIVKDIYLSFPKLLSGKG